MTKEYRDTTDDSDNEGATEEQVERIEGIHGNEALGYEGRAREEHSGENAPRPNPDPNSDLADNRSDQISPSAEESKKTE